MWTNDDIKDWVSEHHGGVEWDAFHDANLVSDQARSAFVENLATKLVTNWVEGLDYLPNVCDPGKECRKQITTKLINDLEVVWDKLISEIDNKLTNKREVVNKKLVDHYNDAYECDAGCTCENISIEYDQIMKWQDDLSARVVEYNTNLIGLIENEKAIIASCPAYIYDSDGNAYFDYSAPVIELDIVEEPIIEREPETIDGGNDTLPTDEQDMEDLADDTNSDLTDLEQALEEDVIRDGGILDENTEVIIEETPQLIDETND